MKLGRNEEKAEVVPAFGNPNRGLAAVLSYNGPSYLGPSASAVGGLSCDIPFRYLSACGKRCADRSGIDAPALARARVSSTSKRRLAPSSDVRLECWRFLEVQCSD